MSEMPSLVPERTVIVVDSSLPIGKAANAAAVVAFTLGQRHPGLVGEPFVDQAGTAHPGVIYTGVSILGATQEELTTLRLKGLAATSCDVVDFPVEGQTTVDYAAFCRAVSQVPDPLRYLAIGLSGDRKPINKIVGALKLLR